MTMVGPALLQSTVASLVDDGFRPFVKVAMSSIVTLAMLRKRSEWKSILAAVARLHCFGCAVKSTHLDLTAPSSSSVRAWYNLASPAILSRCGRDGGGITSPAANVLLGTPTAFWGTDEVLYQTHLEEDNPPFPGHHSLYGLEIVTAAMILHTSLRALSPRNVNGVSLQVPVVVQPARSRSAITRATSLSHLV
ncbi:Acyl transferase/acyl hydrolase/lysophospholipase [Penicillium hordei]|uniref:Acyl transferase/acyl hydrolase/lysophospholipase n=1 Tax=Penicillium hordei TaxID=40994 RepID=A0AAD6GUC3_9EURO|nr:Acyl transferase/acyl hydrolase/lysophospholipase [Penicillium hordei]KAJ5589592.1 Acyl transferase/acyl hydrolase/lysophospholipase [Penicillium hordei]